MEEAIMKRFMLGIVALSIAVCCCVLYLPGITQAAYAWASDYKIMQEEARKREEMTDLELLQYHEEKIEVETREEIGEAVRMILPKELSMSEVIVANDYRNRRVRVLFPGQNDSILNRYPIVGSTNHIDDMAVWSDEDGLYIEFITDRIMEPVMDQKGEYVYLSFRDPWEVYDHILVVDAGHGRGSNPGAVMEDAVEYRINLDIVKKLKKLFNEQKDVKVYYTRLGDADVALEDRVRLANEVQADLFISIHQNGLGNGYNSTNGTQVLYSQSDTNNPGSKKLAAILLRHLTETLGSKNMGLIKGDVIYIIREADMPAALIEVGFLTNLEEKTKLLDEAYQQDTAQAIYDGVMEAFEKGF